MNGLHEFQELKAKLLKKGLPVRYVDRVVAELHDHLQTKRADGAMGHAASPADITPDVITGNVDELAETVYQKMRGSRFMGRHPVFSHVVLPLACFYGVVAFLGVGITGLSWIGEYLNVDRYVSQETQIAYGWRFLTALFYTLKFVIPVGLGVAFCLFSRRSFCGYRWALVSCIALSLVSLPFCVMLDPYQASVSGTPSIGVGFNFQYENLLQALATWWRYMPVAVFMIYFGISTRLSRVSLARMM